MGIDLIQGRDITADDLDGARDVAIVDERFAAEFLTGDAVGQRVRMGSGPAARLLEVIGVTRSTRVEDARDRSFPHVFVPYHLGAADLRLVIKTNRSAAQIALLVKRTAEAHGTRRAVHDIQPMAALVANSVSDARFMMLIGPGFAGMSVLLAAVGLYGTLAYLISRRRQEFGVRLAVGASPRQIVGLVAREGGLLTSVVWILGLAGVFSATGMLRGLLFGVAPLDPVTLLGVSGSSPWSRSSRSFTRPGAPRASTPTLSSERSHSASRSRPSCPWESVIAGTVVRRPGRLRTTGQPVADSRTGSVLPSSV